jgi:hypothetical protein
MSSPTRALSVLAALALSGCSIGNQLVAGRSEYELYRNTRLAPTVEARLAAGNRYLKNEPEGRYAAEIKAWFEPAEKAYVSAAWDSLPRLRAYMKALPDGPSQKRVESRAEELEATIGFAAKREKEAEARRAELEANLDRAAEQRREFLDEMSAWIRTLAAIRSWGKPLAELEPEVVSRFGGGAIGDSCLDELCSKAFTPRFAIPAKQQVVPREAAYSVELVLKGGAVVEARLRGRELFSRLGEALDRRAVSFSDPQSRAEGIGRALSLVIEALGSSLAAESCERPAVSPIVLERACGGVRVVATAALATGEDDLIAFGPETPLPEPPKPAAGKGAAKKAAPSPAKAPSTAAPAPPKPAP